MKRIEFIAPVEAMRGNLSGKQSLVYNPNNNPAWGANDNERSYALNYQPTFIGAKRSDGLKYFQVKTKSAVTMSSAMREQCALLAAQSRVSYIIQHTIEGLADVQQQYEHSQYKALGWTFNRYLQTFIRAGLRGKSPAFFFNAAGYTSVAYNNPFTQSTIPGAIPINLDPDILVKFWYQLADNPDEFVIGDLVGVMHIDETMESLIASNYNVLNLSDELIGSSRYVKKGDQWLYIRRIVQGQEFNIPVRSNLSIIPKSVTNYTYVLLSEQPA